MQEQFVNSKDNLDKVSETFDLQIRDTDLGRRACKKDKREKKGVQ